MPKKWVITLYTVFFLQCGTRKIYNMAIEWAQSLDERVYKDAAKILSHKTISGANTVVSEYAYSAVATPLSGSATLAAL